MSTSLFQAEDWVYVADSMGRLGQGYYKNRNNSSQTITSNEFEKRRSQPVAVSSKREKEQSINKGTGASISSPSNPLLSTTPSGGTSLTPWDNPTIGEQAVSSPTTVTKKKTSPTPQPIAVTPPPPSAKPSPSNQGKSGSNHNDARYREGDGNGGASESAKVICTELVRQGHMRESERRACTIYALSRLPTNFLTGYHFWAVPYVRLMRKSTLASRIIIPLVTWRTREVCHRLGLRKKGSLAGKILCALHDPLCCLIAPFVQKTDYSTLYKQETSS